MSKWQISRPTFCAVYLVFIFIFLMKINQLIALSEDTKFCLFKYIYISCLKSVKLDYYS